ncbi:l-ascorbate oxidase-like protein [Hordeum vulgare]|nr:l-ascorbate oxidase-like protein [Hordeum vulgare]
MPGPSPASPALSLPGHTEGTSREFIVRLHDPPRGRVRLPRPLAKLMEVDKPQGVWLRMHGCYNSVVYAGTEYPAPRVMLLRRGWNTCARAHNFMEGHDLCFKLVEADMLSFKIYGCSGARLGCCNESSSKAESSSSNDSDEEDNADGDSDNDNDSDFTAVKSEYDDSGST